VEELLAGIWAEVLDVERIGIHDNFFEVGGHSLLAVRVTNSIEKTFGRSFGVTTIFQAPTIEQLALLLSQAPSATETLSLVPLQTKGGKPPFFWMHGESSDALLPLYLGPEQPLYSLQHQSHDGRRAVYTTVEDIAAHYLEEIRTVQPEGPFYLGGYCFGGLLAFEMTRQLQQQKQKVALLALLNPAGETKRSCNGRIPSSSLRDDLHRHLRVISPLRATAKWTYIADRALQKVKNQVANSIITPVNKITRPLIWKSCERFGVAIPVALRSSYILNIYRQALREYAVQPLDTNMVLLLSDDFSKDLRSDWCKRSIGAVTIHRVPGNHVSVLSDARSLKTWAEKLKFCLDSAQIQTSEF
jgi:surfactin synthase thioesterase subunit